MRIRSLALLALLAATVLRAEPRLSSGVEDIPRNLIAAGGGRFSGGGLTLDASIGEGAVEGTVGAGFKTAPGLMELIAQPGSVISITAVSKATGTLELAWSSPGLDGFQGAVAAGFYRIDSSSDPLHVFDPTVFLTEFATSTAPGAAQSYFLTGLIPNTTYYSRIYLSDARKVVSETSAPSAESSLARVPSAPAFSGVFSTSVTISWTLPVDGAGGFLLDASSTNFMGGTVVSSRTANGVSVTLTVPGLAPNTTYYFNLASLNWQSDVNFASVLSTRTASGGPLPVLALAMAADNLNRRVTLTWVNPVFANPSGVTILVSTNPISAALADGTPYPAGTVLGDGSIVKTTAAASSYLESALTLDVTGYFSLYSRDATNAYSLAVATAIVLDLPPMAPAGLRGVLSASGTSYVLNWAAVTSHLDGAGFALAAPTSWELSRFDVYRATGIVAANWVWIGSTTIDAPSFSADVPVPGAVFYYRIVSRDAFSGGLADSAMAIDTQDGLWAVHADGITRFQIPSSMAGFLQAAGNPSGKPLLLRAEDRPQDLGGRVVKSVRFAPVASPSNQPVAFAPAATSGYRVALRYETVGGQVVPSAFGAADAKTGVAAVNAPDALAAYYVSGPNAAKLYGHVDPNAQEVSLQTSLLGDYQIRAVVRDAAFNLDTGGVSNRALTPNGDGLNDTVVFTFDNPKDSGFTGKIFDVRGRLVSEMRPGPVAGSSLLWDGKSGGAVVPRGVYMYQIQAEGRTFNGTVVVIR